MARKFCFVAVLMTMASVASAKEGSCYQILWFEICSSPPSAPVRAPEIDTASTMAGLTMLAGGLAVLRGRRRKPTQE